MSSVKTTKGSIVNLSIINDSLQFQIKPDNGYKVTVDKDEYILTVENSTPPTPPVCFVIKADTMFEAPNPTLYAGLLTYWMDKKTLLKFTLENNKATIIEPVNDDKK